MTDKENKENNITNKKNSQHKVHCSMPSKEETFQQNNSEDEKHITDMYVENSKFLLKGIFAVSALFVPLLIKIIYEVEGNTCFLKWSLTLFILFFIMQTISFHITIHFCDKDNSRKKGLRRIIVGVNWIKDGMFCAALIVGLLHFWN